MIAFDDAETSCPHCSRGLNFDALCDCDADPMCWSCHQAQHVQRGRWSNTDLDAKIRDGLSGWGAA